jgi:hypothetical protein
MTSMHTVLLTLAAAIGALAVSAKADSATVVCVENVCWHTQEQYSYPPDARVFIHDESWLAGPHVTFREHDGRGYWKGDTWTTW